MGDVSFYHLARRSVEDALPSLLRSALGQGWRVAVRGPDADRLRHLDEALWLGPKEGFLPHGLQGGPHDARQPVLLTTGPMPNAPHCVMVLHGGTIEADEARGLERACVVFEAGDADAVGWARDCWSGLAKAGLGLRYWSDEDGRWLEKRTANL